MMPSGKVIKQSAMSLIFGLSERHLEPAIGMRDRANFDTVFGNESVGRRTRVARTRQVGVDDRSVEHE